MNRIIVRIGVLSAVVALILFIILKNRSPFGKSNSSFLSEPDQQITKIEFSEGSRKLYLEKDKDTWLINGKTEARKSGVLFILRVLQEIRIKSPVSSELFKSEITDKGIKPVRVKVFEKRKLLKSFLVYKTQSNIYGNIMKVNNSSKPFIVSAPGYEGDIGSGFTLNELFWQTYNIFNLMPSEIALVRLENMSDTASSFSIVNNNHHFILSDLSRELIGWDSAMVTRYLSYFARIPFESWALDMSEDQVKNVESQRPLYKLTVETVGQKKIILTLWERTKDENGVNSVDTDRMFGKTQERNELFIIRYFDIDPLLKKWSYFYRE
ncbi:MAG TPA: hypothetical protein VIK07_05410 [Bacteroidales bacterium]